MQWFQETYARFVDFVIWKEAKIDSKTMFKVRGMQRELYAHQMFAIVWSLYRELETMGGFLADVQGMGKARTRPI